MTFLTKTVRRATVAKVREHGRLRDIVVKLEPPNVISVKSKGCRTWYALTLEAVYVMAVRAHVASEKKRKAEERKAKRRAQ